MRAARSSSPSEASGQAPLMTAATAGGKMRAQPVLIRQATSGEDAMPTQTYDTVIIGGGHNGLVAACYLAKAGYQVGVLERYHTIGGAAISEEIEGAPGHFASTG